MRGDSMSEDSPVVSRRTLLAFVLGGGTVAAVDSLADFANDRSDLPTAEDTKNPSEDRQTDMQTFRAETVGTHVINRGSHRGENNFAYFLESSSLGLDQSQPDEVYSSLTVKLDQAWRQPTESDTAKIFWAGCNLSAGLAGQGGHPPTGDDGWSVRAFTRGPVSSGEVAVGAYVYHLDQSGDFGDSWQWPDTLAVGDWNRIESYVKLNSVTEGSANRDGIVQMWLDDDLQIDRRNLRWRTTERLGFDRLGPGSYWGGSTVSPANNVLYYDRFAYTRDVGTVDRSLGTNL